MTNNNTTAMSIIAQALKNNISVYRQTGIKVDMFPSVDEFERFKTAEDKLMRTAYAYKEAERKAALEAVRTGVLCTTVRDDEFRYALKRVHELIGEVHGRVMPITQSEVYGVLERAVVRKNNRTGDCLAKYNEWKEAKAALKEAEEDGEAEDKIKALQEKMDALKAECAELERQYDSNDPEYKLPTLPTFRKKYETEVLGELIANFAMKPLAVIEAEEAARKAARKAKRQAKRQALANAAAENK